MGFLWHRRVMMTTMLSMNVIKDTAIENAFHFTSDDLTENQQGRLSYSQVAYLRGKAIGLAAIVVAILAGLGLAYLGVAVGVASDLQLVVLLRRELAAPRWPGAPIAMGTNVDCYQRAEGHSG